ncbi:hypothetical protein OIU79_030425 [Salix purpurea]|uniref:Uncharacterized protein n=1 Tax=Salix purpurea TaxID=77065 RepID=A0A9Q0V8V1_SALPP|nr:hypothetical protein OIU79_030425 [Salix purpurea]
MEKTKTCISNKILRCQSRLLRMKHLFRFQLRIMEGKQGVKMRTKRPIWQRKTILCLISYDF